MIDGKEKLTTMTQKFDNETDQDGNKPDDDDKVNSNRNNGNKEKRISPLRSLDLSKYGAVKKTLPPLSPEHFIIDPASIPDIPTPVNEDAETTEFWSKLRCGSLRTEEVAEREKQRQLRMKNRQSRQSSDYPGLAFGSAMFGSDTTMKFNIIKNELHNIMRSQLKRVDGEMNAFSTRVKEFDKNLEESENYIRQATSALAEVVTLQAEEDKSKNEDNENESNISAFDQHVLFLETQLREARIKASQSFQILEDCDQAQESLFTSSSPPGPVPKSSSHSTPRHQAPDSNGNTHNSHNNYTKEMEENIANGNVGDDVTNGNITVHNLSNVNRDENTLNGNVLSSPSNSNRYNINNGNGNINCFKAILSEQDSANANLPL